jgi:hypothetical protein
MTRGNGDSDDGDHAECHLELELERSYVGIALGGPRVFARRRGSRALVRPPTLVSSGGHNEQAAGTSADGNYAVTGCCSAHGFLL